MSGTNDTFYIHIDISQNTRGQTPYATYNSHDKMNVKPEYGTQNVILVKACKILSYLPFSVCLSSVSTVISRAFSL